MLIGDFARLDSTQVSVRMLRHHDQIGLFKPDSVDVWSGHRSYSPRAAISGITGQRTFGGLRIPGRGRLGWHFGTDRWPDGEFFRYGITTYGPCQLPPREPSTRAPEHPGEAASMRPGRRLMTTKTVIVAIEKDPDRSSLGPGQSGPTTRITSPTRQSGKAAGS